MIVRVGIALGSNLGDRSAELDAGVDFLCLLSEDEEILESPRFETEPVGCPPGSPPFLNAVVEISVDSVVMTPLNLLDELQEFETERGRSRLHDPNSPRPLDLDIIYYGIERFDHMGLIIPHPRAHLRRFVLEPLAHIRPDLVLPGQMKTVAELLQSCSGGL